jgi:hypothetical protein
MNKVLVVCIAVVLLGAFTLNPEANTRYNGLPVSFRDATVRVVTPDGHVGSGVVVREHIIATAYHVAKDDWDSSEDFTIELAYGAFVITARPLIAHPEADICLLETDWSFKHPAKLATNGTLPEWGEAIAITGHPMDQSCGAATGTWVGDASPFILAYDPTLTEVRCEVYPGNSGSPVWDVRTRMCVGIVSCYASDFHHIAWIVHAGYVAYLLRISGSSRGEFSSEKDRRGGVGSERGRDLRDDILQGFAI